MRTIFGAALVFLCAGAAYPAGDAPLSAGQTISYLIEKYKVAGLHTDLVIGFEYSSPMLRVTWQRQIVLPDTNAVQIDNEQALIDLRYARFDAWNDGRRDRNVMLVECADYFPCFRDKKDGQGSGHGEIDYLVRGYAAEPIAAALNHLASFNVQQRPRDKF
ncbi:MAG: hypothetical protein WB697_23390 [Stellaceae bacterium]